MAPPALGLEHFNVLARVAAYAHAPLGPMVVWRGTGS